MEPHVGLKELTNKAKQNMKFKRIDYKRSCDIVWQQAKENENEAQLLEERQEWFRKELNANTSLGVEIKSFWTLSSRQAPALFAHFGILRSGSEGAEVPPKRSIYVVVQAQACAQILGCINM